MTKHEKGKYFLENTHLPNDCPPNIIEVRYREEGILDEIISDKCYFHLEQMSEDTYWMGITKNGYRQVVNFKVAMKDGKPNIWTEMDGEPEKNK